MSSPYSYKDQQPKRRGFFESAPEGKADREKDAERFSSTYKDKEPPAQSASASATAGVQLERTAGDESRAKALGDRLVKALAGYAGVPEPSEADLNRFTALAGQNRKAAELLASHLEQFQGNGRAIPIPGTRNAFPKGNAWYAVFHWLDEKGEAPDPEEVFNGGSVWHITWSQDFEGQQPLTWEGWEDVWPDGPNPGKSIGTNCIGLAAEAQKQGYNVVGPGVQPAELDSEAFTMTQTYLDGTEEVLQVLTPVEAAELCREHLARKLPNAIVEVVA